MHFIENYHTVDFGISYLKNTNDLIQSQFNTKKLFGE